MQQGYFHRVAQETPTRLWINNPTIQEVEQAIAAGAISCTTNPTYCARLLDAEPDYIRGTVEKVVAEVGEDDLAAERVYQKAVQRLMAWFLPLYEESGGRCGFVTIQGDPRKDDNPDHIIAEALRHRDLGKNVMAKIPLTIAGAQAIETMVAEGVSICATEIFSVSQAIYICEAYRRAAAKTGKQPPFYVTHITGIFDQYLADYVQRERIDVAPDVLAQAGWAVAHEQYRLLKERGYDCIMLGGGARGTQHFTDVVGGDMHVTINWSTAQSLIEADGPVVPRLHEPAPRRVVDELSEKLPDFRKAFYEGALSPAEFKDYGPLVLFRSMFLDGYRRLLEEVAACRAQPAGRA